MTSNPTKTLISTSKGINGCLLSWDRDMNAYTGEFSKNNFSILLLSTYVNYATGDKGCISIEDRNGQQVIIHIYPDKKDFINGGCLYYDMNTITTELKNNKAEEIILSYDSTDVLVKKYRRFNLKYGSTNEEYEGDECQLTDCFWLFFNVMVGVFNVLFLYVYYKYKTDPDFYDYIMTSKRQLYPF